MNTRETNQHPRYSCASGGRRHEWREDPVLRWMPYMASQLNWTARPGPAGSIASGPVTTSRGGAASVKRSRPGNVKSSGYPQLPIWPCFVTILLGSTAFQGYFVACYWKSPKNKKKLNFDSCGNRTLKCDATQTIIRYWLNSGPNIFFSVVFRNSGIWLFWTVNYESYWILHKTKFWLNSLKSELSQIWPNDSSCFTPKVY